MNDNIKEILESTDEDTKKLNELSIRTLKESLEFSTFDKVVFSILAYIYILGIYNHKNMVMDYVFLAAILQKLSGSIIIERLARKTDDLAKLENLKGFATAVNTVMKTLGLIGFICVLLDLRFY